MGVYFWVLLHFQSLDRAFPILLEPVKVFPIHYIGIRVICNPITTNKHFRVDIKITSVE